MQEQKGAKQIKNVSFLCVFTQPSVLKVIVIPGDPFQNDQFSSPASLLSLLATLNNEQMETCWRQTTCLFCPVLFPCPGADICVWQAEVFSDPRSTRSSTAGSSVVRQPS